MKASLRKGKRHSDGHVGYVDAGTQLRSKWANQDIVGYCPPSQRECVLRALGTNKAQHIWATSATLNQ